MVNGPAPVIPNIVGINYPPGLPGTMPSVVGFSIRENPSQIYLVEQMRVWLVEHLIPYVNTSVAYLSEEWQKYAELLIAAWDARVAQLEAEVAAAVAEMGNQVDLATAAQHAAEAARDQAAIYASEAAAIQDTAVTSIFNNAASAFRTALNGAYATLSEFNTLDDTVQTGRLSAATLATTFAGLDEFNTLDDIVTSGRLTDENLSGVFVRRDRLTGMTGEVYGLDYGISAGVAINQSAALQAAIDDAGSKKARLVLPNGVIRCDSPVKLHRSWNSITGSHMTVLDFTNIADNTVAVTWDVPTGSGAIPLPDYSVHYSELSNLTLFGPTGKTVDGIALATLASWTGRVILDRVNFTGFKNQETVGSSSYLHRHYNCSYTNPGNAAILFNGVTDFGENISWTGCVFSNQTSAVSSAALIVANVVNYVDAYFLHCSFDYSGRVLNAVNGQFEFASCHFESASTKSWFTLANIGGGRDTVLVFTGGQLVPHDVLDGSGSIAGQHFTMIETDETGLNGASVNPARIVFNGPVLQPRIQDITLVKQTGARRPIIIGKVLSFLYSAMGEALSSIRDSTFKSSTVLDTLITTSGGSIAASAEYTTGKGWFATAASKTGLGLTLDQVTQMTGGSSVKINAPADYSGYAMSQVRACESNKPVTVSLRLQTDNTWTGVITPSVRFYDGAWNELQFLNWSPQGNTKPTDPGFRIVGGMFTAPAGTRYVALSLNVNAKAGQLAWIDEFDLTVW